MLSLGKMSKSNENCCVSNCRSVRKKNPDITFHRFPKPEQKVKFVNDHGIEEECSRRNLWISKLRMGKAVVVAKSRRVCSLHFTEDDYEQRGWSSVKRLKPSSVPSQCLPNSSQPCSKKKRNNAKTVRQLRRTKTIVSSRTCQKNRDEDFEEVSMLASNPILSPLFNTQVHNEITCKNEKEVQTDRSELRDFGVQVNPSDFEFYKDESVSDFVKADNQQNSLCEFHSFVFFITH